MEPREETVIEREKKNENDTKENAELDVGKNTVPGEEKMKKNKNGIWWRKNT